MNTLQFGTSVRDITPGYPVWAHGYAGRTRQSSGVREPLSLGCLAAANGDTTVLIVSLDMIGVRSDVCDGLYALLEKETGIGLPNLLITASHTHFAPALHATTFTDPQIAYVEPDPKYVGSVKAKLIEAARESLAALQPGQLESARMRVPAMLFNRRTRKDDGLVHNCLLYPEDPSPYTFSPVDDELTVLRVCNDDGVQAVLVNFGCHPVTGCSPDEDNYKFSADYPYYVRRIIAEKWACPVFFTLGAAGDAVPINRRDDCRERIGSVLGNTAILAERTYAADASCAVKADMVEVEAETIIQGDPAVAAAEYEAAKQSVLGGDKSSDAYRGALADFRKKMTAYFRSRLYPENKGRIRVQFIQIGSTVFVGLPFEVLAEISLKMKKDFSNSVLASCAGGYQGYLPLAYEYDRGGYEATPDSTHFKPGTADRLLSIILDKLAEW